MINLVVTVRSMTVTTMFIIIAVLIKLVVLACFQEYCFRKGRCLESGWKVSVISPTKILSEFFPEPMFFWIVWSQIILEEKFVRLRMFWPEVFGPKIF